MNLPEGLVSSKQTARLTKLKTKSRKTMGRSISQRLSESSSGTFVGRKPELEMLMHAINAPELPFVVAYIHGPGGIGKSFLLQNLTGKITSSISQATFLDCRDIEPTITGLQTFVPGLPDAVLILIASRYAPKTAWLTTSGWQSLFKEIELRELSDEESTQMLKTRLLNSDQIQRVKMFAHGHPLALELGAAALRTQPDLEVHLGSPAKIITQLSRVLLSDLSKDMIEAVEAVSTVRWTTEPILRALMELTEVRNIFDKISELPFVFPTQEGLILHDVVHDAVSNDLKSRDPERYCLYRSRAWQFFSSESQKAQEHLLWHLTADMLYLIENPIIREAFFPKGSSDYVLQSATKDDYLDIVEIAFGEETQEAARLIEQWLNQHPESFSVAKGPDNKVAGFYFCFEPHKVDRKLLSTDPLTAAWSKNLEQNPINPEERVLFLRRWLARKTGEDFSPVQGACWVDIKRTYMEMRPHLRRLYTTVNDLLHSSVGFW
jgi:ABC-type uncharacterized transport system ATPase subunit